MIIIIIIIYLDSVALCGVTSDSCRSRREGSWGNMGSKVTDNLEKNFQIKKRVVDVADTMLTSTMLTSAILSEPESSF